MTMKPIPLSSVSWYSLTYPSHFWLFHVHQHQPDRYEYGIRIRTQLCVNEFETGKIKLRPYIKSIDGTSITACVSTPQRDWVWDLGYCHINLTFPSFIHVFDLKEDL